MNQIMEQENKPHHYGYGQEYLHHERDNERHHSRNHHNRDAVDQTYKSQPIRYLRLIWDEKGVVLEYTLRFNNTRRGFWMSSSPQKGKIRKFSSLSIKKKKYKNEYVSLFNIFRNAIYCPLSNNFTCTYYLFSCPVFVYLKIVVQKSVVSHFQS